MLCYAMLRYATLCYATLCCDKAPAGARIRIRAGTTIASEVVVCQPLQLVAEEGVTMQGKLTLHGGTLVGAQHAGAVHGLRMTHFMHDAITVHSGRWTLQVYYRQVYPLGGSSRGGGRCGAGAGTCL